MVWQEERKPRYVCYVMYYGGKSVTRRIHHWADKEESLCLVPGRFWLKKTLGKLVPDPTDGWRLEVSVAPRAGQTGGWSGVKSWERKSFCISCPGFEFVDSYQHWRPRPLWSPPDSPPGHAVSATPSEDTFVRKERKSTCMPVGSPRQVRLWICNSCYTQIRANSYHLSRTFP